MPKKKIFIFLFLFISLFLFPKKIFAQLTINEFVPDSSTEWIELYNASSSAEFIKEYYIDDDTDFNLDSGNSGKKLLSTLNISSTIYPYFETSSFLNNKGDYVCLFDADGNLIDSYQYTENPGSGVSIGRNPDGSGSFYILSSSTKGSSNSFPKETSTSEPTSTPTPEPTPTPTSSPSPIPTKTFSPSPIPRRTSTPKSTISIEKDDDSFEILGIQTESSSPTPQGEEQEDNSKPNIFSFALIVLGIGFIGFAGFAFFKAKGLNKSGVEDDQETQEVL